MQFKKICSAALAAAALTAFVPNAAALSGVSGWAVDEVGKAEQAGLAPDAFGALPARENITRAEFCAVSLRLFESSTGRVAEHIDALPFTDTADPQVVAANALGLVSGRGDGTFDPYASVTRQELCVMLGNVLRAAGAESGAAETILAQYDDAEEVAGWARGDMSAMADRGVISGVRDGEEMLLSPRETATREQSLMMAVRFLESCGTKSPSGSEDKIEQEQSGSGLWEDPEGIIPELDFGMDAELEEDFAPSLPAEPIRPDTAYDLTETEKNLLVFGGEKQGYDTPEAAEAAMTEITVPVWRLQKDGSKTEGKMTVKVNAALAKLYEAVFLEIFHGEEQFPIKDGGSYAWRSNARSEHRWGTAIDLNWDENMECNIDENGNVTQITTGSCWEPGENPYSIPADGDVVRAFKKYGFSWGGDAWSKKRDYMHFSYFGR